MTNGEEETVFSLPHSKSKTSRQQIHGKAFATFFRHVFGETISGERKKSSIEDDASFNYHDGMSQIGRTISKAIKEGHWVLIDYHNKSGETTTYWIAILDVFHSKDNRPYLKVNMYNASLSLNTLVGAIEFDSIQSATLLPFADYDVPKALTDKLDSSAKDYPFLEYDSYQNSILNYYLECRKLDNDPFQKEGDLLPGIDVERLLKSGWVSLNEEQEKILTKSIIEKYGKEEEKGKGEYSFAITVSAIEKRGRIFIVCYHSLTFNPATKRLTIHPELSFNTSFLCRYFKNGETTETQEKFSLQSHVNMDLKTFIEVFRKDKDKGLLILRDGLAHDEYLLDSRNEIVVMERLFVVNLESTFQEIEKEYQEKSLPYPLRAFFGNVSRVTYHHARKEPYLVIYDEKTNINQILALYNALKYPVTYVQGPPGTGKTQTLINVILSAFFNKRTVLMTSGNNKPVDAIITKLSFYYHKKEIPFPWLRLGNNETMLKALDRIKKLSEYSSLLQPDDSKLERLFENHNSHIQKLLSLLDTYEKRQDIRERADSLKNFLACGDLDEDVKAYLNKKLEELRKEYQKIPAVRNEDVIPLCHPVSGDNRFLQYLHFESLKHILLLKKERFKVLLAICNERDEKKKVRSFNQWLSNDENLALLNSVFPILFCTNISSAKLGTGNYKFDLTIMDEAGQCSVADSLLPIARGKNLLLLGDQSQLHPVILLDEATDEDLCRKYQVDSSYAYSKNSILSIMRKHDNVSKFVFLSYHYRCGKKIIEFSNQRFYGKQIIPNSPVGDGKVELHIVENKNAGTSDNYRNSCYEEAKDIVSLVKAEKMKNTTILCPFVNQVNLINEFLDKESIPDVRAGTIHTMQGAENDTVILSTAISMRTRRGTYDWICNNSELFNVASTRAKKRFIVYADTTAIHHLAPKGKDDLSALIEYTKKNGNIQVEPNEKYTVEIGYSNNSASEAEFWKTMSHLCSVYTQYTARRNVPEKDVFAGKEDDENLRGEFDLVLYEKKKPIVAFEVNGIEHALDKKVKERDERKKALCKKMGLKLIPISNQNVKDYEFIKEQLRSYAKERAKGNIQETLPL